jgi:hypothetical protein
VEFAKKFEDEARLRRTDDGSDPDSAKLEKASESVNEKGHVSVLGSKGIHRVDNLAGVPAEWFLNGFIRNRVFMTGEYVVGRRSQTRCHNVHRHGGLLRPWTEE